MASKYDVPPPLRFYSGTTPGCISLTFHNSNLIFQQLIPINITISKLKICFIFAKDSTLISGVFFAKIIKSDSHHHVNATYWYLHFGHFARDAILCPNFFYFLMVSVA